MPRTVSGAQRTQGAQPPDRLDLKLCNCATCGKECIGLTHAEFAHHFGKPVAAFVLQRPYCPSCAKSAGERVLTCAYCGSATRAKHGCANGSRFYCLPCDAAEVPAPWRHLMKTDRHFPNHDNIGASAVEIVVDAA